MNASPLSATVDFFRETLTSPNTGWSILVRLLKSINTSCRTEKPSCSRVIEVVLLHKLVHYANHCRPDAGPFLMEYLSAAPLIIKHGVGSRISPPHQLLSFTASPFISLLSLSITCLFLLFTPFFPLGNLFKRKPTDRW